jgi:hypothetical protein
MRKMDKQNPNFRVDTKLVIDINVYENTDYYYALENKKILILDIFEKFNRKEVIPILELITHKEGK